jgi:hypothetical protein
LAGISRHRHHPRGRGLELTGNFAAGLTGRAGVHTRHAILAHGQRLLEVEYVSPADTETFRPGPCDVGSVHVALTVADIGAAPDRAGRGGLRRGR